MAVNQQFCLRWNNHQRTLISVFDSLLESGTLVDCTLAAEGQYLKAHKVVLSACSPYLGVLLSSHHEKHPILILKDIKFQELKAMLDYMYRGEVNISQEQLCTFLKAAESLQIKGLTESAGLNPETKDFEDRLVKRYDRKCPSSSQMSNHNNARTRSPPAAIGPSIMNSVNSEQSWNQQQQQPTTKYSSSSNYSRPALSPTAKRDGSLSPTTRKRRKQQHPMPSVEDTGSSTPSTTNGLVSPSFMENHQDCVVAGDPLYDSVISNNISSSNSINVLSMNMNNIKAERSEKIVNDKNETHPIDSVNCSITTNIDKSSNDLLPVVPKQEPKCDDKHSDAETGYDDSVEEMTIEDEEEEMDEIDLSRPGPSHGDDSHNYGSSSYPLSSANDGTSGQLDCQEPSTDPLAVHRFVCRLCGKLYQWKQSLTRHIREDRCDKGPQHACPRCGIIFKHTTRLNRHILFCPNMQTAGDGGVGGNHNSSSGSNDAASSATLRNVVNSVAQAVISASSSRVSLATQAVIATSSNSSDNVLSPTLLPSTTTLS